MIPDKAVAVSDPQSNSIDFCMIVALETQFRKAVDALSEWLSYPGAPRAAPEWRKRYTDLLAEVEETLGRLCAARALEMKAPGEDFLNKGHEADGKH